MSFYLFIKMSFYFNIVCQDVPCEWGFIQTQIRSFISDINHLRSINATKFKEGQGGDKGFQLY